VVFRNHGLEKAVRRLGLIPEAGVRGAVAELADSARHQPEGTTTVIVKVIAGHALADGLRIHQGFCELPLTVIDAFIKRRFHVHRVRKIGDRYQFPSDLMQYLIWREEVGG
jgi:hypothetical protein